MRASVRTTVSGLPLQAISRLLPRRASGRAEVAEGRGLWPLRGVKLEGDLGHCGNSNDVCLIVVPWRRFCPQTTATAVTGWHQRKNGLNGSSRSMR